MRIHFAKKYKIEEFRKHVIRTLTSQAQFSYQYSRSITPLSGTALIFAYLVSYFIEHTQANMYFDTLILRFFIAILIFLMIFRDYWLPKFGRYQYVIWLVFLGAILPYCFGSILILNAALSPEGAVVNLFTVTEYVLSSFFLVQLVFHIPLILIVWFSSNLLILIHVSILEQPNLSSIVNSLFYALPFFGTVLLVGGIINKRMFNFEREKEQAVWNVANAIAHQLRTPLATIRNLSTGSRREIPVLVDGYQKAVRKGLVSHVIPNRKLEILSVSLDSIIGEVEHSGALIDILIANSKPFQHLERPQNKIQISSIILSAIDNFPYNNPAERELVSFDQSSDFRVNGLESMILHVMFNLIGNAVEFSQKRKGGRVRIWLEQESSSNKVIVWDSGIGIPPQFLYSIFEPFFSKNSQNGTGIGLSFCKSVMEGLGGQIKCDSKEGEYCQFTLFFPKTDTEHETTPTLPQSTPSCS